MVLEGGGAGVTERWFGCKKDDREGAGSDAREGRNNWVESRPCDFWQFSGHCEAFRGANHVGGGPGKRWQKRRAETGSPEGPRWRRKVGNTPESREKYA